MYTLGMNKSHATILEWPVSAEDDELWHVVGDPIPDKGAANCKLLDLLDETGLMYFNRPAPLRRVPWHFYDMYPLEPQGYRVRLFLHTLCMDSYAKDFSIGEIEGAFSLLDNNNARGHWRSEMRFLRAWVGE